MKKSKNNNIILGFGYWVFEFGFSWCKGKVNWIENEHFDKIQEWYEQEPLETAGPAGAMI